VELIRLRNEHPAFAGQFTCSVSGEAGMVLRWENGPEVAEAAVDFLARSVAIRVTRNGALRPFALRCAHAGLRSGDPNVGYHGVPARDVASA
jgi:hypothetical protein